MSDSYSAVLVQALRLGEKETNTLVRDLLDRGAKIPKPEQMTTDTGRATVTRPSVDGLMDVMAMHFFEHHQRAIGHKGNPLYDDLRKRLTKYLNDHA